MKKIRDILKKKISCSEAGARELDEKTIVRVFLEAAKGEIKNLEEEDIWEIRLKEKTLYLKTAHPVLSSELFLRREKILEKTNEIAGKPVVEKIIVN